MQAKYNQGAVKALLADGGTARRAFVEKTIANVGGRLEALYFTFGAQDAISIVDLPDNATAAALSMNISAGGTVQIVTTPLLTCEEIDAAARTTVDYTPPGG